MDSVIGEIKAPSELSHAKLGRKRAKKATSAFAVGKGLDFFFMLPRLSLGEGFEFWELKEDERTQLANALVECMEALPKGDNSAFAKFVASLLKFIQDVAPFVGLAGATYATLAWRIMLTKQLRAAHAEGVNVRSVEQAGRGGNNGTADTTRSGVQGSASPGNSEGGSGGGTSSAAFGNAASLFTPPPHVGATGNGAHVS